MGEGENAGIQYFRLSPKIFWTLFKTNFKFSSTFILLSANDFNFDRSKILYISKELMHLCYALYQDSHHIVMDTHNPFCLKQDESWVRVVEGHAEL